MRHASAPRPPMRARALAVGAAAAGSCGALAAASARRQARQAPCCSAAAPSQSFAPSDAGAPPSAGKHALLGAMPRPGRTLVIGDGVCAPRSRPCVTERCV